MALLIVGINAETVDVTNAPTVSSFVKDYDDRVIHTLALTLKADGVVLTPRQSVPKDVVTLELIEVHDPDVVGDTANDVVATPMEVQANASETMSRIPMSEPGGKDKDK